MISLATSWPEVPANSGHFPQNSELAAAAPWLEAMGKANTMGRLTGHQ
jgi:hypothetical protein